MWGGGGGKLRLNSHQEAMITGNEGGWFGLSSSTGYPTLTLFLSYVAGEVLLLLLMRTNAYFLSTNMSSLP